MTAYPGQLKPTDQPEVLMMICTAGHVDHGKTALVKNLTGCNTDRLKEEQERGMTIELGFAPCVIGAGVGVGIVDVPGHERFVRTMVSGVSGIAFAMLVIAADDGVMPQTVEHLRIMELLGVRHGLVALTKIDLADAPLREQRAAEIRALLKGTFLDGAPLCPVSSITGEGYGEFYDTLVAALQALAAERRPGLFRLPVERTFAIPGRGAIISGIPISGRVSAGDELEVVPGGARGRVRGLQCFGRDAKEGWAGQCLALNVPDFGKEPPPRGAVLCPPGYLRAARMFHVRLQTVPALDTPVRNAEEIKFHAGTTEAQGVVYLLEDKTLRGDAAAFATVVLEEPLAAASFDRFILRRPSPAQTLGGGEILLPSFDEHRPRRKEILALLGEYAKFFTGVAPESDTGRMRRAGWVLHCAGRAGVHVEQVAAAALLTREHAREALAGLKTQGTAVELDGGTWMDAAALVAAGNELDARVAAARAAGRLTLPLNDLKQGFEPPSGLWSRLRREREGRGAFGVDGDQVILQVSSDDLPPEDRDLARRMRELFEQTGYHSPRLDELPEQLKANPAAARRIADYLLRRKELIKIADNVVLSMERYRWAQDFVVRTIQARGAMTSQEFRDTLDTSRKYAMAILDFMDARQITLRAGNDRKLKGGFEKKLL